MVKNLRNASGTELTVVGHYFEIGETWLAPETKWVNLSLSTELTTLIGSGDIVVNDGFDDLTPARGQIWVTLFHSDNARDIFNLGEEVYDTITVTTPNQVSFTLSNIPRNPNTVRMSPIKGIEQLNDVDFNIASDVVSYIADSSVFDIGDKIVFKYFK